MRNLTLKTTTRSGRTQSAGISTNNHSDTVNTINGHALAGARIGAASPATMWIGDEQGVLLVEVVPWHRDKQAHTGLRVSLRPWFGNRVVPPTDDSSEGKITELYYGPLSWTGPDQTDPDMLKVHNGLGRLQYIRKLEQRVDTLMAELDNAQQQVDELSKALRTQRQYLTPYEDSYFNDHWGTDMVHVSYDEDE